MSKKYDKNQQNIKMDLQQNDRTEEWFLIIGEWLRETPKLWFYTAGAVVLLAIPSYMFLNLVFETIFIQSQVPIRVNQQNVAKLPLEIVDKKIFPMGNNTYAGYVRIKNSNSDWGAPNQAYSFIFKNASGNALLSSRGEAFILPAKEKVIVFPRFSSDTVPTQLDFALTETKFVRAPTLPTLNLEIQRRSINPMVDQTIVSAVIVNDTPFTISRVDLPVLLFDSGNQVVGSAYTNINDLASSESRSFQYTWPTRINNAVRAEIIPEINVYNRDIFLAVPGKNPFDDIE